MSTILITGVSSGIGKATLLELLKQNHRIIATVRTKKALNRLLSELNLKNITLDKLEIYIVNLEEINSIIDFLNEVKTKYPYVDAIVANAGKLDSPYKMTPNGFERIFQVNFLSHFFIIESLITLLLNSENPTVISIVDSVCQKASIQTIDQFIKIAQVSKFEFSPSISYRESKFFQQLHMDELAFLYKDLIKFYCVFPGKINSNLYSNSLFKKILKFILNPLILSLNIIGKIRTPLQGAQEILFLLNNPNNIVNGGFYSQLTLQKKNPICENLNYRNAIRKQSKYWTGLSNTSK